MCVQQLEQGRFEVENQYARAVRRRGNAPAQGLVARVFRIVDRKWRGHWRHRRAVAWDWRPITPTFDAETRFSLADYTAQENRGVHQWPDHARRQEAGRMFRLCHSAAPRSSSGRSHGFLRRAPVPPTIAIAGCGPGTAPQAKGDGNVAEVKELRVHCPTPVKDGRARVQLAHGGGGRRMHELLEEPAAARLRQRHAAGSVMTERPSACGANPVAFTTDSYVVKPLFFPGGDIGSLAVNGTVNDLAMCGALPLYLQFRADPGRRLADGDPAPGSGTRCARRPKTPECS